MSADSDRAEEEIVALRDRVRELEAALEASQRREAALRAQVERDRVRLERIGAGQEDDTPATFEWLLRETEDGLREIIAALASDGSDFVPRAKLEAVALEQREACAKFIEQASLREGRPVHAERARATPLVTEKK